MSSAKPCWVMVAMVWPGTKMVTARSLSGGRLSATGSLTTSAPAGISTVGWPWKSAGTAVPLMAPTGAGECDVGAADLQRCGAEGVAENDADARAADRDVDDLAQGGVVREVAVAVA